VGVDIAAIPKSAVGRVEILKDGAAAVYGSDAIGGVVNFIMRDDFEGFEVGGSFQHIDESDGDWDINGIWGTSGDNWSWMVAAEYAERGELPIRERDWALVNTDRNRPGGWSGIGNPANGQFRVPVAAGSAAFTVKDANGNVTTQNLDYEASTLTKSYVDPKCADLGARRAFEKSCGFNYAWFDNLIEKTETTNIYTAFNIEINENHRLHLEALHSDVDIPAWKTSPSYPPQSLFGPDRVLQSDHPGLVDFNNFYGFTDFGGVAAVTGADIVELADTSGLPTGSEVTSFVPGNAGAAALAGLPTAIAINRAFGVQGAFGTGLAEAAQRVTETERYVIGLDGVLFDESVNYDVSISYSKRDRFIGGQDMYVERMGLALRGYGGPSCKLPDVVKNSDGTYWLAAGATAPGTNGCEYYNPFSRAVEFSAVNGVTNPDYNPAVANSDALSRWLIGERGWTRENELLVFQAVFSGDTNWELGGGTIGYAFGAQTRNEQYVSDFWDISDRSINPCPYTLPVSAALGLVSADQLTPNCVAQTGVAAFLAASDEEQTERTVYSFFGELAIPLTEDVDVQAALRFEDYGGNVGASLDPKLAVNWRITQEWSLRGSASTTFRGPPQSILGGTGTALSFVGPTGAFKAIDTVGNPNLSSESAVSTNFGVIYQNDRFYGSLDWWSFAFEDSFQTEGFNDIVGAYSSNGCTGDGTVPKDSAVCNELRAHIFPKAAHTRLAATERIVVNWINGEDIDTSGIDLSLKYDFAEAFDGTFDLAFDGTYLLEYDRADQLDISGTITLAQGGDLAGFLNYNKGPSFTSKPEIQASASLTFENDVHYAGLIVRHVGSYDDSGAPDDLAHLATIDRHTTFDGHYVFAGLENWRMSLSIVNIADEDPPEARGDLSYDPFTHNAFGRMIKLGVSYSMAQ
jgi:iron complex outermembrane receptor protein